MLKSKQQKQNQENKSTALKYIRVNNNKKSAVPDLQMALGIVHCFSLNASAKPTSRLTLHTLEAHVSHTHPSQKWETDGAAGRRAMLWL